MLLFSFAYQLYFCFPLPLQNGGECLRAYVSVSLEQIAQWRDEQGNNGLWYVMQVVNQLLDPRTSEFTAAFVGRLVSTLISRAGTELGEQLDQILRAILSKMQQAETLSVMQVKPMFCSFISIWMIQLTDTDLTPLLSSVSSLWSWCLPTWFTPSWSLFWSSCAVFPGQQGNLPWSLSWRSGWADSTYFTASTRAKSGQMAYLFLKFKMCRFSTGF